jgi:hypothetical protein
MTKIYSLVAAILTMLTLFISSCSPANTVTASPFQGALSGSYLGSATIDNPDVDGTFTVSIDSAGNVQGSFKGAYEGTVTGQVEPDGSLSFESIAMIDSYPVVFEWKGKISKTGNSLSVRGYWTMDHGSGTFSGTGTSSK